MASNAVDEDDNFYDRKIEEWTKKKERACNHCRLQSTPSAINAVWQRGRKTSTIFSSWLTAPWARSISLRGACCGALAAGLDANGQNVCTTRVLRRGCRDHFDQRQ